MKRAQIQIPDLLYREIRRVAELKEWSISEVFRRAAEQLVSEYPDNKVRGDWQVPGPRSLGAPLVPADRWRDLLEEDQSSIGQ